MNLVSATYVPEMWIQRDWSPNFDAVKCPVFILAGSLDEQFLACAMEAEQKVSNAKVAFIRRVGHQIPLEAPVESAQLFIDFLKQSFVIDKTLSGKTLLTAPKIIVKV